MGKNGRKKRVTVRRQVVSSYAMVLLLSIVSSFIALLSFYSLHHHMGGYDNVKLGNANVRTILEYVRKYGDGISEAGRRAELDKMAEDNGMEYYVKDMKDRILFTSSNAHIRQDQGALFSNLQTGGSISIPLENKGSGKIDRIFVLAEYEPQWLLIIMFVDIGIPFTFFFIYSMLFTGRISRRIGTPLKELMEAAGKIKNRDLDFTVGYHENNELGDLSAAFEDMRSELERSLTREWRSEQDRREMTAAITHDIKTPLAIIQGHVEGLQEGFGRDDAKRDEYLGIIGQNVSRVRKLVDEMNELVEVDSGDFGICREEVDPSGFLKGKTGELALLAANQGIRLNGDITDLRKTGGTVYIDRERLSRVIDNLAGNGIRFTPRGGSVTLSAAIEDNGMSVSISDTGSGFTERDLKNLFRKFYRGGMPGTDTKGHSGLGLYIAKTIVEKHGGVIKAFNLPGGGACVEFDIVF